MNKKWFLKWIVPSLAILLPMVFGFIIWDKLPGEMAGSRLFIVVVFPLILFAFHWLCVFISSKDITGMQQNEKILSIVRWLVPGISWFASGVMYASAFGKAVDVMQYSFLLFALLFLAMGNYLPKCKRSYTMGIKVKWALSNDDNWRATHRLAGKLWMIAGAILAVCVFLPLMVGFIVLFVVVMVAGLVPTIYSWQYYKKQVAAGTMPAKAEVPMTKDMKRARNIALIAVPLILVGVAVFMFVAKYEISYGETSFIIDAIGWDSTTVEYAAVESVEYRETCEAGARTYGFGDIPLQMGLYTNSEFGSYIRYARSGCKAAVVVKYDGKTLVINGKDAESTKAIYEELLSRTK